MPMLLAPSRSITLCCLSALLIMALGTARAPVAYAEDTIRERVVSVTASGELRAEPDVAQVSVGVVSQAKSAKAALADNNKQFAAVLAALKQLGIAPADIATNDFQVSPIYNRQKTSNGAVSNAIEAFRVVNSATVTIRDLRQTGTVIDVATENGANQLGAVRFEISGIETKLDYARRDAMENAIRRAKLYATAAGAALGEIFVIEEQVGGHQPRYVQFDRMATSSRAEATPIEAGQQTVRVTIHAVWKLK